MSPLIMRAKIRISCEWTLHRYDSTQTRNTPQSHSFACCCCWQGRAELKVKEKWWQGRIVRSKFHFNALFGVECERRAMIVITRMSLCGCKSSFYCQVDSNHVFSNRRRCTSDVIVLCIRKQCISMPRCASCELQKIDAMSISNTGNRKWKMAWFMHCTFVDGKFEYSMWIQPVRISVMWTVAFTILSALSCDKRVTRHIFCHTTRRITRTPHDQLTCQCVIRSSVIVSVSSTGKKTTTQLPTNIIIIQIWHIECAQAPIHTQWRLE